MKNRGKTLFSILFIIFAAPAFALAGSATLHWQPNTESDLAGYRIYYGTSSRSYGPYISVGKNVTSYTLNNLTDGKTYYFALTAVDTSGNESGYSREVSKTIGSEANEVEKEPDFNDDSYVDILWRNYSTGENGIWVMKGTSVVKYISLGQLPDSRWHMVGSGDFNRDGSSDILWRNYQTGEIGVWLMNGTKTLKYVSLGILENTHWHIEGTGDFNKDGYVDILWRNYETGENGVWLMNGTKTLKYVSLGILENTHWHIEGTGDFNKDGYVDILWRNYETGENGIWLMNKTTAIRYLSIGKLTDTNWKPVM